LALNKIDVISLGRGNLTDNSNAAIMFSANNLVSTWTAITTYAQYNVVEYSGKVYRSKVASNLNLQPDTNPNSWEVLYSSPKDGDVAFIINGASSQILQRKGTVWSDITGQPLTISLTDGQLVATDAFVFLGSQLPFAKVEYTVKRGSGEGRKRKGEYNILNDASLAFEYDHEFLDIGVFVNVTFSWAMSAGFVRLRYTSVNEGSPIELKYSLRGW
jgi:hypothetical protein